MIKTEKYESMGFLNWQIEELKLAFKNDIDPELIDKYMVNVDLDSYQLKQIRLGLQDELDVSLYARKDVPAEEMEKIRLRLLEDKLKAEEILNQEQAEIRKQELKEIRKSKLENIKSVFVILLITILLLVLGSIGYLFRESIFKSLEILELDLPTDVVELNYGDDFNADNYVLKSSDGDDIVKIFPTYFETNELGDFDLEYVITNNVKSIKRVLKVRVVDKIKPNLVLSTDEVSLTRNVDTFEPNDYIDELSDNYDDEPTLDITELDWSKQTQEITYTAKDSSDNTTVQKLTVYIKDKPKPVIPSNNTVNNQSPAPTQSSSAGSSSNSNSNNNTSPVVEEQTQQQSQPTYIPPTPEPQQPSGYIRASSISVPMGTDIGDVQARIVGGIESSSGYSIDFSEVNTSAPGSYTVYIYGNDGSSTTCTVTVTE